MSSLLAVLCIFRSGCLDSYRALVLKPTWDKPYYRCAESLGKLGDVSIALSINERGRKACDKKDDLERQYTEFQQSKLV